MDAGTFHAIYKTMPDGFKAELIGGDVMMPLSSPPVLLGPDPGDGDPDSGDWAILRSGDRLDDQTYIEIYKAMPEDFKAELIGGVVVIPSAVSGGHAEDHLLVAGWLLMYHAATPGTRALSDPTLKLSPGQLPQPDGAMLILPKFGGQSWVESGFISGPPELVIEVATGCLAQELHSKYRDYEAAGVREYVVLIRIQKRVEWFVLRDGHFEPLPSGEDGLIRSVAFPGLWLDPAAAVAGDGAAVLRALRRGLASPEHEAFVEELQARRPGA